MLSLVRLAAAPQMAEDVRGHLIAAFAVSAALALVFVGLVRWLALRHNVIDIPNERSSHASPTPRGGGVGIWASILISVLVLQQADMRLMAALLATTLVAAVGWLDDQRGLGVQLRLAIQTVAALVLGAIVLTYPHGSWLLAAIAALCWTFWAVTTVNVVNFMDGINGLVASQVALFALSLTLLTGAGWNGLTAVVVVGACAGFLPWNFPRARIFLGDAGSGSLGLLVALLSACAMYEQSIDPIRAQLPLFALFTDAGVTLLRRYVAGERITQAHRSHLYQRLANGGLGHTTVTLSYGAAAGAGLVVAQLGSLAELPLVYAVYVVAVLICGWLLERKFPFTRLSGQGGGGLP